VAREEEAPRQVPGRPEAEPAPDLRDRTAVQDRTAPLSAATLVGGAADDPALAQLEAAAGAAAVTPQTADVPVTAVFPLAEDSDGMSGAEAPLPEFLEPRAAKPKAPEAEAPKDVAPEAEAPAAPETEPEPAETAPAVPATIRQRHNLPMRKAGTMPADLKRYEDTAAPEAGRSVGTGTASLPVAAAATAAVPAATAPAADDSADSDRPAPSPRRAPGAGADPAPQTTELSIRPPEDEVNRRVAEREEAVSAKPLAGRILQTLLAVFFPFMLVAGAIRALTTPLFLWIEYHRPGFPVDTYGFSVEDRMTYGSYALDYVMNWAGPRYLGEVVNTEGDNLFLPTEVTHMQDVKWVLALSFVAATVMLVFSIFAAVYLARKYKGGIRRALFAGSVATIVLIGTLAVVALLAWDVFFTALHNVFFAEGSWTFRFSDTLIRLFPPQFWMDAGIAVGALVLMTAVTTLVFTWPTRERRRRSMEAQREARLRPLTQQLTHE
jgi:integral membrane protein (TIGR01906 family)